MVTFSRRNLKKIVRLCVAKEVIDDYIVAFDEYQKLYEAIFALTKIGLENNHQEKALQLIQELTHHDKKDYTDTIKWIEGNFKNFGTMLPDFDFRLDQHYEDILEKAAQKDPKVLKKKRYKEPQRSSKWAMLKRIKVKNKS